MIPYLVLSKWSKTVDLIFKVAHKRVTSRKWWLQKGVGRQYCLSAFACRHYFSVWKGKQTKDDYSNAQEGALTTWSQLPFYYRNIAVRAVSWAPALFASYHITSKEESPNSILLKRCQEEGNPMCFFCSYVLRAGRRKKLISQWSKQMWPLDGATLANIRYLLTSWIALFKSMWLLLEQSSAQR